MKRNFIEIVLNLFFPPVCGMCNEISNTYICDYCLKYLKKNQKNRLNIYNDKFFKTHFWLYEYKNEIREQIINYKFNDKPYLHRTFVELILTNPVACKYIQSFDILIPVPIHKKRLKKRGYNQSELIAKKIAKEFNNIELRNDLIKKKNNIIPQSTLNKDGRIKNVINAYEVFKYEDLVNKRVLILDDIYTTGSTVNECARMLLSKGCSEIGVFTIAKD